MLFSVRYRETIWYWANNEYTFVVKQHILTAEIETWFPFVVFATEKTFSISVVHAKQNYMKEELKKVTLLLHCL